MKAWLLGVVAAVLAAGGCESKPEPKAAPQTQPPAAEAKGKKVVME
jgi:hypothetical protein